MKSVSSDQNQYCVELWWRLLIISSLYGTWTTDTAHYFWPAKPPHCITTGSTNHTATCQQPFAPADNVWPSCLWLERNVHLTSKMVLITIVTQHPSFLFPPPPPLFLFHPYLSSSSAAPPSPDPAVLPAKCTLNADQYVVTGDCWCLSTKQTAW